METDSVLTARTKRHGFSPLHCAVLRKDAKTVQYLVNIEGVDLNAIGTPSFGTPLTMSVRFSKPQITKILLGAGVRTDLAAAPNHKAFSQPRPLDSAVSSAERLGTLGHVEALVNAGVVSNEPNGSWRSPWGEAIAGGRKELIQVLDKTYRKMTSSERKASEVAEKFLGFRYEGRDTRNLRTENYDGFSYSYSERVLEFAVMIDDRLNNKLFGKPNPRNIGMVFTSFLVRDIEDSDWKSVTLFVSKVKNEWKVRSWAGIVTRIPAR